MITLRVRAPFASFRKSYARSFAETYAFAPPATVYGMLLSLVGESLRATHVGARMAFAYKRRPKVTTTLRKLSRLKYGVVSKQAKLGNAPDFVETLCGIDFLCALDSAQESATRGRTLEVRVREALEEPSLVTRTGVVCLGLSDDAVDEVSIADPSLGEWHALRPRADGEFELPVWVDHVGALHTRWQRFQFDDSVRTGFVLEDRDFVTIVDPR